MSKYRCIRKIVYQGSGSPGVQEILPGEVIVGEEPRCNKGRSLVTGKLKGRDEVKKNFRPSFVKVSDDTPETIEDPGADDFLDTDTRTKPEIVEDIWTVYGVKVNPRLSKQELLAREKEARILFEKDVEAQQNSAEAE